MTEPMRNRKKLYPHDNVLIEEYNKTQNPELIILAYKLHGGHPPRSFRIAWENIARQMAAGEEPLKYNRKRGKSAITFMSYEEVQELLNAQKERNERKATKYQSIW